nr:hypothetical protein [Pseudomonas sp. BIGb0427]
MVAWLVQGALTVHADAGALKNGNEFEKSTAVVDLLLNLVMVLFHASLPKVEPPVAADKREIAVFGPGRRVIPPSPGQCCPGQNLSARCSAGKADLELDFSWYGPRGLKSSSMDYPRPLSSYRSATSLENHSPLSQGPYRGFTCLGNDTTRRLKVMFMPSGRTPKGSRWSTSKARLAPG